MWTVEFHEYPISHSPFIETITCPQLMNFDLKNSMGELFILIFVCSFLFAKTTSQNPQVITHRIHGICIFTYMYRKNQAFM